MFLRFLILVLLFAAGMGSSSAPASSPISTGRTDLVPLSIGMERLRPGLAIPHPSTWATLHDSLFVSVDQPVANFGYQAGAVLLRMVVVAPSTGRWWLQADYPGLDSLRAETGGKTTGWVGEDIPYPAWSERVHCPSLPLDLTAGPNRIHLQVIERGGRTIVPLRLRGDTDLRDGLESFALADGLILGVIATNILVGLYLLVLFRRPAHAWYVVYLGAVGLFLVTNRHHAFPLLWPRSPIFNAYNQSLFSLIGLGALGLFHVHILGLMRHARRLGWALRSIASLLVVSGLLMFATPWTHALHRILYGSNLSSGLVLVSMGLGVASMILRTIKGDRTARALLLVTLPTLVVIAAAFVAEIQPDSGLLQHRGLLVELFLAIETCGITLVLSLAVNRERRVHAELLQRHLDLESSFVDRIAQESDRHLKGTAMDLHDGVGQSIASQRMRLHAELAGSEPEAVRRLDAGMAELAREVRDTARRMHPPELHDGDLEAPLRRLLEDVPVRWHRSDDLVPFSEQEAYQIYRSLQEALRNALDHGKARSVELELGPDRIRFHDDGNGFASGVSEGLGMRSIRQRMAEIGWAADWISDTGGGCILELRRAPRDA
jgi:signal transduction histidine kinase